MNKEEFINELNKINIKPTEKQQAQLEKYYLLLIEWNTKINLTRIIEKKDVYLKHYYDSLTITKAIDLEKVNTLCDVGTGAGFPGIVLKIIYPNLKVTLIDSLNKRVKFLNKVIEELELEDIKAIHIRGEDYKEKFDVVTSRAVANIEKLMDYTMHLVNNNGVFIAMKGNIDELNEKVKKHLLKKYEIVNIIQFELPKENGIRSLIVIKNK